LKNKIENIVLDELKKQKDWTLRCKLGEWVMERVFMFVCM